MAPLVFNNNILGMRWLCPSSHLNLVCFGGHCFFLLALHPLLPLSPHPSPHHLLLTLLARLFSTRKIWPAYHSDTFLVESRALLGRERRQQRGVYDPDSPTAGFTEASSFRALAGSRGSCLPSILTPDPFLVQRDPLRSRVSEGPLYRRSQHFAALSLPQALVAVTDPDCF